MKHLLREPLLHFLLGGAALFLLYAAVGEPRTDRPDRIVVTEERVAMLARTFERTWMRPPTAGELQGLIDDYVAEELLYREALSLGLDRDDLVVRRRMRQKMEFLTEGISEVDPDEADLRRFYEAHPQRFRAPPRLTFTQVFVAADADDGTQERAEGILDRLREGSAPDGLGDPTLLPRSLRDASPGEIAGTFGSSLAEALEGAPEGRWSGPYASGLGLHLVRVEARRPARLPPLAEVRPAVEREWAAERREQARERLLETLRERYEVEVQVQLPPTRAASAASRP